MKCPNCGAEIPDESTVCSVCHADLTADAGTDAEKELPAESADTGQADTSGGRRKDPQRRNREIFQIVIAVLCIAIGLGAGLYYFYHDVDKLEKEAQEEAQEEAEELAEIEEAAEEAAEKAAGESETEEEDGR